MTRHQKRLSAPTSWPVERKTETFTIKSGAGPHGEAGVPLLVLLRDVLGYVDSRKEARYALDQGSILVNGEPESDEARPIGMFDIIGFDARGEYFRVFPDEGGRLALTEIDEESADSKLSKIDDKIHVPGGEIQLNLHDGSNLRVEGDEYSPGDSIVVDNEDSSVVAHFVYEEGNLVTAVAGQHAGDVGRIVDIEVTPGSASNNVTVETLDDEGSFETVEEYVVVIDENFVEGDVDEADASEEEDDAGDDEDGGEDE